jgi:hypothetical protein
MTYQSSFHAQQDTWTRERKNLNGLWSFALDADL